MDIPEIKMKAFSYGNNKNFLIVGGSGSPYISLGITLSGKTIPKEIDVVDFPTEIAEEYLVTHLPSGERFNVYIANDPTLIDRVKSTSTFQVSQ